MSRQLTDEESKIINLFSPLTLKEVPEYSNVTLSYKKQRYFVFKPKIYSIENTDSFIILGDTKQAIDINLLKKLLQNKGMI